MCVVLGSDESSVRWCAPCFEGRRSAMCGFWESSTAMAPSVAEWESSVVEWESSVVVGWRSVVVGWRSVAGWEPIDAAPVRSVAGREPTG